MKQGIGYQKRFVFASAQSNRVKIQPSSRVKEKVKDELLPSQNCLVSQGQL